MNRRFQILLLLAVSVLFCSEKYDTWLSPTPDQQIIDESIDDQLGMGRLFVPVMSVSEWEPLLRIYNTADRTVIDDYRPGTSIFLKPGKYTLLFGSSDDPLDKVQKHFTINQHQTTLIEPDWSGLIVSFINENMEFVRFGYEILHFDTEMSAGTKYSREESVYDDMNSTWILPPGKYKLVRQGEPFNTIVNFSTFELKPGELKEMTVVINDAEQFIGSGEIGILENMGARKKDWNNILNLKGSFTVYSHNKDDPEENTTDIIAQMKIDNKIIYDSKPYYLSLRQFLHEELTKTGTSESFRVSLDEFSLINTGIYYFTNIFGFFAELNFSTKIFSTNYYDIDRDILKIDRNDNTTFLTGFDKLRISDTFTPLHFEERFGLNFTFIKTSYSNLYLRTGLGFVQKLNDNVYALTSSTPTLYTFSEEEDQFEKGIIFTAGSDFNITNNITYISTANFFYNLDKDRNYNLKWDNDINFKLFRFVSLDYSFILIYDYDKSQDNYIIYDNRIAVELSYFINR